MAEPPLTPLERFQRWWRALPIARSSGDTIAGQVGEGARGVVIGKNVIQIEQFNFPLWMIPLFLLLVLAAALLLWRANVPARMPEGTFNIAVATFGEEGANGRIRSSEKGEWFSQRTYDVLDDFYQQSGATRQVTLWHDSLGWTEKRSTIGLVTDDSAPALTERLNADIVVYGHVSASGQLALNFYAHPDLQSLTDSLIVGRYEVGDPIHFPASFDISNQLAAESANRRLQPRVSTLALVLQGLEKYFVGDPSGAILIWEPLRAQLGTESGADVMSLLVGMAYITPELGQEQVIYDPEQLDKAEEAFREAASSRSLSVSGRARIGLGNVHFVRAQQLVTESPEPDEATLQLILQDLQLAISEYEAAINVIQQLPEPDPMLQALARIASTPAHRLQGQVYLTIGQDVQAEEALDRAIAGIEENLPFLIEAEEYRLVAQGYSLQGNAFFQKAFLAGKQGDAQASSALYQQAVDAYDACIAQGELQPTDNFLQDIVQDLCLPRRDLAAAELG